MPAPEQKDTLVPASGTRALKALAVAAEAGEVDALFELGYRYLFGEGVSRDERRAYTLWRKSAGRGHAASFNNLGCLYAAGRALPQDDKAAFSCYQKAAALDHDVGQLNLGRMYLTGRGTPQNLKKARLWIKLSAQHGNGEAQALLKETGHDSLRRYRLSIAMAIVTLLVWSAVYLATLVAPVGQALAQFSDLTRIAIQALPVVVPALLLLGFLWRKSG